MLIVIILTETRHSIDYVDSNRMNPALNRNDANKRGRADETNDNRADELIDIFYIFISW